MTTDVKAGRVQNNKDYTRNYNYMKKRNVGEKRRHL